MPTRTKSSSSKKRSKQLTKQQEKDRVDAWMRKRGHGTVKSKPGIAPLTAAQIRNKKAEELRKKGTPSGLQHLVDIMSKKKKKEK